MSPNAHSTINNSGNPIITLSPVRRCAGVFVGDNLQSGRIPRRTPIVENWTEIAVRTCYCGGVFEAAGCWEAGAPETTGAAAPSFSL